MDVKLTKGNLIKKIIIKGKKEKVIPVNINLSQKESISKLESQELKLQQLISSFYGLNKSKVEVDLN